MGCHSLLQGTFPTQRSNPALLNCRQILYHLSHQVSVDFVTDFISRLNFASFSLVGNNHQSRWSRCFYWVSPGLELTYSRAECWTLQSSMGSLGILWTYSSTWCIAWDPKIVCLFLYFFPSSFFFFYRCLTGKEENGGKMQFKLTESSVLLGLVRRYGRQISTVIRGT